MVTAQSISFDDHERKRKRKSKKRNSNCNLNVKIILKSGTITRDTYQKARIGNKQEAITNYN